MIFSYAKTAKNVALAKSHYSAQILTKLMFARQTSSIKNCLIKMAAKIFPKEIS